MRASCVKVLGRPTDDAADRLGVTGDDEKDDKHSEARKRAGAAGRPNVCVAGGRGGRARAPAGDGARALLPISSRTDRSFFDLDPPSPPPATDLICKVPSKYNYK